METHFSQQRTFLSTQFFRVVARALRRDMEEACEFFRITDGTIVQTIHKVEIEQLPILLQQGFPYRVTNLPGLLEGTIPMDRAGEKPVKPEYLEGWRREAYDHALLHLTTAQGWAREDLGLAALMCGFAHPRTISALAELSLDSVHAIASRIYGNFHFDQSICLQLAMLMSEAQASPDRTTTALAGRRLVQ